MEPKLLIKPAKLKPGDIVGVISPSLPIFSKKDFTKGVKALESFGLQVKVGTRALEVHGNYQAGPREDRLKDLHEMFLDDEVKAIFCAGGGYSSLQLLPDIDWEIIQKNPKIFVGFSDNTALLVPIFEKTGLVTFHGPTVEGWDITTRTKSDKFEIKNFKQIFMKGETGNLKGYTEWKTLKPGKAEGTLVGGNLDTLLSLVGTPYEPKWDGKILFWEDVDVTTEDIENYLWRLRIAKILKKIDGMIVGKITDLKPIDEETSGWAKLEKTPTIEEVIINATKGFDFPILYGVDFGHIFPSITLPIGAQALIDCPAVGKIGKIALTEKYLAD